MFNHGLQEIAISLRYEGSTKPTEVATNTPPMAEVGACQSVDWLGTVKRRMLKQKNPPAMGGFSLNFYTKNLSLPSRPQRPEGRLCRLIFQ